MFYSTTFYKTLRYTFILFFYIFRIINNVKGLVL